MKFKLLLLFLVITRISYGQSEQLSEQKINNIKNVIRLFQEQKMDEIANGINYPLRREYPISNIKNKKDFIKRYAEVFDKTLIDKIANSKIEDWSEMGWRGIMLDDGVVWIESDSGKIIAVNYQSSLEQQLEKKLISNEKEGLHSSLKTFESPTYKIKTKKYLIRIDELANHKYRYASWKIGEKESSKPDIILNNGEMEFQGSGGNHQITFVNHAFTYRIYRNIIGETATAPITLEVEKDGEIILREDGVLVED